MDLPGCIIHTPLQPLVSTQVLQTNAGATAPTSCLAIAGAPTLWIGHLRATAAGRSPADHGHDVGAVAPAQNKNRVETRLVSDLCRYQWLQRGVCYHREWGEPLQRFPTVVKPLKRLLSAVRLKHPAEAMGIYTSSPNKRWRDGSDVVPGDCGGSDPLDRPLARDRGRSEPCRSWARRRSRRASAKQESGGKPLGF